VSFDVFGTGRTAVRMVFGRYPPDVAGTGTIDNVGNPGANVATTTNRAWTDANRNYVADCDLLNPAAQDLRSRGGDMCGQWSNLYFAKNVATTTYDPAILAGWNLRPYSWDLTATVQHQLLTRMSVELTYARRIYGNFVVTDNRAVGPQDYDPYTITAPVDPRLPDGGGYQVTGLYDIKPEKFGLVDNFVTDASRFGKQTEHYNGVDISVNLRPTNGLTIQGGYSAGRSSTDACDVTPKMDDPSPRFCHLETPFHTNLMGLIAYTIPRIDLQVGGTFVSKPYQGVNVPSISSQSLAANWVVSNALIAPSLGRNLAGGAANATVNLVEPGTLYGDRLNLLDVRVAKRFTFGPRAVTLGLDVFNLLNSSAVLTYNQTYGVTWLTPQSILVARFAKVSAQYDF
jgi:hypothetical protein